ncbi:DNA polymerase III subunit alpha, partial [Patescibacteria group bacterium]|nr:DNA polymerase III subunit alpha [Patescibacteria group bacterium]
LGLLKMDFLGLKNLTIIEDTLARIYVLHNQMKIDMDKIPEDDPKTFKLLQEALTTSVFQLESDGMKRYLKELKPSSFEDITAMVALYRPGPMQFIPDYIARKHGNQTINYIHPALEPILKDTQGICIYQEQLMKIAQEICGFTLGEADVLRKAVGKKIKELLDAQEAKFIDGAVKNGVKKKVAEELWQWILPFASYGFNKSHSAAYATIAYHTAYLKAHYPVEFMASVLTSEKTDVERIAFLIDECGKMDVEVLPPNINESLKNFAVVPDKNQIRFGFLAIKNVGANIAESIVEERKANGSYKSIGDFIYRVKSKDLNKKSMEALIKAGAFDQFEERNKLLQNLEKMLEIARENHKNGSSKQIGLFASSNVQINYDIKLDPAPIATNFEKLSWEKELLGLYVSSHPLNEFKVLLEKKTTPISKIDSSLVNQKKIFGGLISSVKKIITKNGKPMLFMKLEDLTGKIEVVVFPNLLERNPEALQENKIVFVAGRVDDRNGEIKVVADDAQEIITPREA